MRVFSGMFLASIVLGGMVAAAAERGRQTAERVWKTEDGSRTIRGRFVDISDGEVRISTRSDEKEEGELESLPLKDLSRRDREFLARQGWFSAQADVEMTLQTKEVSLNKADTPLSEVIRELAKKGEVPIFLDGKSLEEARIDVNKPLKVHIADRPLETVLREILTPLGLHFSVTSAGAVL